MRQILVAIIVCVAVMPMEAIGQDRYDGPIIDMHLHTSSSIWAEEQICMPKPCTGGGPTIAENISDVREMTLEAMDKHNIVLGFLSGEPEQMTVWTAAAPGRFLSSPAIDDPLFWDFEKLRGDYEAGHYSGMGEIATQYAGFAPSDPQVAPFFALAAEFDVPTLIHMGGTGAPIPSFRVSKGDPRLLEEVLVRHPALRVFIENCAAPFTDEVTAMMFQYPQLYCDISTILHLMPRKYALRHLRQLVENGLGKRIMFGSDQMIWPEVIPVVIDAIQTADFLTVEQRADIFYNNAARFLRLSDAEIAAHHGR